MAYCTVQQLASALRIAVTAENQTRLTDCIEAAATELDSALDRIDPGDADIAPAPNSPALIQADNLFRAIQWYKANDTAMGAAGSADTGALIPPAGDWLPRSIVPYKEQWGIA